jgi:Phosphoesterase family
MVGRDGVRRSGRPRVSRVLVGCLLGAVLVASAATSRVAAGPESAGAATAVSGSGFGRYIKHVVVFYQENHSFDETLGRFCQEHHGRCDGFTGSVHLKGGKVVAMQPSPDVVPSAPHDVRAQKIDMDGGAMDGWAVLRACHPKPARYSCLTYYAPSQIPNLAGLAAKFVVSDRTFSMADSPSWGGHLYAAAATQDNFTGDLPVPGKGAKTGPGWGCDSGRVAPWANPKTHALSLQPSCIPARPGTLDSKTYPYRGAYKASPVAWVPTIFDRLDAKGLKWKLYSSTTVWSRNPQLRRVPGRPAALQPRGTAHHPLRCASGPLAVVLDPPARRHRCDEPAQQHFHAGG